MSLLTICQQVAREVGGLFVPGTIVGNQDEGAQRLLALAQREGKALSKKHRWAVLQKEHTFTTTPGTAAYSLPEDCDYLLSDTAWDRTQYRKMRGSLTPAEWQWFKSASQAIFTVDIRFRLKLDSAAGATKVYLDPTPADSRTLVYEYVSTHWCQSANGTGCASWNADTNTARISEDLIELGVKWRLMQVTGLAYADQKEEYEREVHKAIARDVPAMDVDMARRCWLNRWPPFAGVLGGQTPDDAIQATPSGSYIQST